MEDQDKDNVSLADPSVEISNFERYKGRKGCTDRIAILSTSLVRSYIHYYEGGTRKHIFHCLSAKEKTGVCCETLGPSQQRFGMVLFKYQTDDKGEFIKDGCSGKVLYWLISEARYEELSRYHKQWCLLDGGPDAGQVDLMVTCTEENFQKMSFATTKDAHWKKKPEWYKALKGKETAAKVKIKSVLGKKMTEEEIKDILGLSPTSMFPTPPPSGDIDLGGVIGD